MRSGVLAEVSGAWRHVLEPRSFTATRDMYTSAHLPAPTRQYLRGISLAFATRLFFFFYVHQLEMISVTWADTLHGGPRLPGTIIIHDSWPATSSCFDPLPHPTWMHLNWLPVWYSDNWCISEFPVSVAGSWYRKLVKYTGASAHPCGPRKLWTLLALKWLIHCCASIVQFSDSCCLVYLIFRIALIKLE